MTALIVARVEQDAKEIAQHFGLQRREWVYVTREEQTRGVAEGIVIWVDGWPDHHWSAAERAGIERGLRRLIATGRVNETHTPTARHLRNPRPFVDHSSPVEYVRRGWLVRLWRWVRRAWR